MMGNSDNFRKEQWSYCFLKIISEGDCYGYQISQTMKKLSNGVIAAAEGSMYTALNKLEKKGCVSDYRRRVGDRPGTYILSLRGRRQRRIGQVNCRLC